MNLEQLPDSYNGVLIYLPAYSRFDKANGQLFVGRARTFCGEVLARYGYSIDDCCIRHVDDLAKGFPGGTQFVICQGEECLNRISGEKGLDAHAGFVRELNGIPYVFTYWAQDCVDVKDEETSEEDEAEDASSSGKDSAPTARANYRFWFAQDIDKMLSGRYKSVTVPHLGLVQLNTQDAVDYLNSITNDYLYLDIETHPPTNTIQCFSFCDSTRGVATVLNYDYRGNAGCDNPIVMAALAKAIARNIVVIHNSMFDLLFLAAYHGMPFGRRNWDTMLVQHRLHLEIEKSLAHAIRLFVNAPYHKGDYSSYTPYNYRQQMELLLYNAKDVQTLRAVHKVQLGIYETDVRTRVTIQQADDLVYLYSLMSLQGIGVDMVRVKAIRDHNDEVLVQLRRILRLLVGNEINPSSPQQLVEYFHKRLGYTPVEKTAQGEPSLEADCLYKLLIETGNPVIKVVLLARKIAKQNGMLKFKWMALKRKRVA